MKHKKRKRKNKTSFFFFKNNFRWEKIHAIKLTQEYKKSVFLEKITLILYVISQTLVKFRLEENNFKKFIEFYLILEKKCKLVCFMEQIRVSLK